MKNSTAFYLVAIIYVMMIIVGYFVVRPFLIKKDAEINRYKEIENVIKSSSIYEMEVLKDLIKQRQ